MQVNADTKIKPTRKPKPAPVKAAQVDIPAFLDNKPKAAKKKTTQERCKDTIDLDPTIRAYLRVSTDKQDVENQRMGVSSYITRMAFREPINYEDSASSKIPWRERTVGKMLEESNAGDIIIVSEVTRLARSTLEVLEIFKSAAEKGLVVHIVKNNLVMDGSLSSKIIATMLGLAGEIEREFIAARTTESLKRRQSQLDENGFFISRSGRKVTSMGRPTGEAEKLSLDPRANEIDKYLEMKLNKRSIAKLIGCAPTTLYDWLNRRRPEIFTRKTK